MHGIVRTTERPPVSERVLAAPPIQTLDELVQLPEYLFAKTHRLPYGDTLPAVYLIRDGRDALISYAHFVLKIELELESFDEAMFRSTLHNLILEERSPFGTWASNAMAWSRRPNTVVVRFEDLIARPLECAFDVARSFGWTIEPRSQQPPTFEQLRTIRPDLFRSGQTDQWRSEFPTDLLAIFNDRYGETLDRFEYSASPAEAI